MERCDMQGNHIINTAYASGVSTQTRSTPAYSQPFGYPPASTGSADTDRSTPPQSNYSHRNGEADDLARQPYDRNQTAYTQLDRSQWSMKHPHALPEISVNDPAVDEAHPPSLRAVTDAVARPPIAYISWKEPRELEDFSRRFDGASSELLAQFDKYDYYNRLALLQSVKDAYERKTSFTLGGDSQFECRECVGYGRGKNRCPSVVLRDSGNASDRCDECGKLHRLHEQWIDRRKKRETS
ncbi:hypothetical protein FFLO_00482 [Filobasidium floriforme]|uniref:Uncharacterized protein n=1 Tax=Filobasidium floriforme TaxID=5210 RepID=A0A8K0JSC7_9TREE|nr:uncharacterized protein HD553DRAFT_318885 [Filobasidium floriforme]KAG7575318.1 hypothetical protein FFLO_00482 [Filobasidium floriforme]KAH8078889.1 hypothetical protein HD553DRAFT_318885 [Filobasidium floriforme]